MISNSLEWEAKRVVLKQQILNLPYNKDLRTMLKTIDAMVVRLSKAEVDARRNHKDVTKLQELQEVNRSIENLEKWIIMGSLLS